METEENSLKQQFQLLQEQQQRKLQRRKQRKEESSNLSSARSNQSKSGTSTRSNTNVTFGVDDDLDLKLSAPAAKSSSYLSEDLVNHLNDQIRELKDENSRVYKLLSEKDFEMRQMKKKTEDKARLAGAVTNETAASKIVDLSKKVRELTAELESEKTKVKQYGKKCLDLQKQLSNIPEETRSTLSSAVTIRTEEQGDDYVNIKALQEKVKYTENKMTEHRNQCSLLKQELKTAHKVLAQEVGDNVDIKSILNSPSGWKGRAQQILNLSKKVDELKYELSLANKPPPAPVGREDYDLEGDMFSTAGHVASAGSGTSRQRTAVEKQREQIRRLEKERKEIQERSSTELKSLEEECGSLRKKLEAAKARNGVLSNQMKSNREQMKTLIDKGQHDDELIQALMKQQTQLRKMLEDSNLSQQETSIQKEQELKQMSMKTQHDSNIVEQLKTIVTEKEAKVHRLEDEIQQLKLNHLQRAQIDTANMLFHPASVQGSRPPTITDNYQEDDTVNVEFTLTSDTPSHSSMSDRPPVINSALDRCPSVNSTVIESARPSSRKSLMSPAPPPPHNNIDKQALMELQSQCQEYKTMMQVAEVERDRLSELVKILQARSDENVRKLTDSQNELVQQRRKNVLLEKQIGKSKIEQGSLTQRKKGIGRGSNMSVSQSFAANDDDEFDNIEEMRTNLEIQRDENEALKAALQSTLKAKEEDMKLFTQMMEDTKRVFLQALKQYKQNVQGT